MKLQDLRKKIIFLQVLVSVLAVFLMIMGVAIKLQSETLSEWRHVIDFLKLWIEQNDLRITPPTKA